MKAGSWPSPEVAAEFLDPLQDAGIEILPPGMSFAARLWRLAADLGIIGARIFDLQIGLCALDGGATELWTRGRRFVKFPGLVLRDPFEGG